VTDPQAIAEYLRRSYFAADGLWFMKVEEACGFDEALRLDVEVWRVLGKIQARRAREILGVEGRALADLIAALNLKFAAEQYDYGIVSVEPERAEIEIRECPWIALLQKSGRQHLAARVAEAICSTDYEAWAREFDPALRADLPRRMCGGEPVCRVVFHRKAAETDHPSREDP
jgi:hypothetical protein